MVPVSLFVAAALAAPTFDAGSDGSYGPLFVAAGTTLDVVLPADGTIHATDITVEAGATLTFTRNINNTPVYLLSQGDVVIDGVIDVSGSDSTASTGGAGGPGGFDGGTGTNPGNAQARPNTLVPDRNLLHLIGGRGGSGDGDGAPNCGGGGGGGALLIASSTTITLDGVLDLNAGSGACPEFPTDTGGDGYPGHVRLVAPVVTGTGDIDASQSAGTLGYVRVDSLLPGYESLSYNGTTPLSSSFQVTAGNIMIGRLDVVPTARITSVAGQGVATESGAVSVIVPAGSPTTQDVVVEVAGLAANGTVTVSLQKWQSGLTGVSNATFTSTASLDLGAGETSVTIPVTFEPLASTWLLARVY